MKKVIVALVIVAAMVSCAPSTNKKVMVMGRGNLSIANNKITMKGGSGYAEKEMTLAEGQATLSVETDEGTKDVTVPADGGYYVLNLEKDTLAGSIQLFGKDISNNKVITQEELKMKIDSLQNMVAGTNINGKTNFMIVPGQVTKVSDNQNAQVYGPYNKIPNQLTVGDDNKEPEIYKFYTNSGLRELIKNLSELTY